MQDIFKGLFQNKQAEKVTTIAWQHHMTTPLYHGWHRQAQEEPQQWALVVPPL